MGDIGRVVGGVAGGEVFRVGAGFDADASVDDREEFAGALEVWGATEGSAFAQADLIEFDVLFEVEGGEGSDGAVIVRPVLECPVVVADDGDAGYGGGCLDEFCEGEIESTGDAGCDGEGWVGAAAFDLAEHGAADTGGLGEVVERPSVFCAEAAEALAEGVFGGGGGAGAASFRGCFHLFTIMDDSSCIVDLLNSRCRTLCSIY